MEHTSTVRVDEGSRGGVFLTWHESRRSATLAERLGLDRHVLVPDREGAPRHLLGAIATAWLLIRHRPEVVWYQFSLVLGFVLALYVRCRPSVRLIADVHTKALKRSGPAPVAPAIRKVKRFALSAGQRVVVTNEENRDFARQEYGVDSVSLPDPLPTPPSRAEVPTSDVPRVVFVCSFAEDEPLELIINVARRIHPTLSVAITGDDARLPGHLRDCAPDDSIFPGFVPDARYWGLLHGARAIVVLSTEAACLPCGAYEAIAVGRRPILADDPQVRNVFQECARYCPLTVEAVTKEIRLAVEEPPSKSCVEWYEKRWQERWARVRGRL